MDTGLNKVIHHQSVQVRSKRVGGVSDVSGSISLNGLPKHIQLDNSVFTDDVHRDVTPRVIAAWP